MVTIRNIAQEAGYSASTVSRVLSGHRDVSDEARLRIQQVVDRHQYVLNRNAQNLKLHHSRTLVAVIKGRSNLLFQGILEVVQSRATAAGYAAVVEYIDEDANEVERAAIVARQIRPAGFIFLGGHEDSFRAGYSQINVPAVLVTDGAVDLHLPALSSICTDDASGARRAIDYLIDLGHRVIGVVGGNPAVSFTSRQRLIGVDQAIHEAGLVFDRATQYVAGRYSLAEGQRGARELMTSRPDITAIFAMGDIQAIGVMRGLADLRLAVPGDVSVVGFDGLELSQYVVPRLVTVRQLYDRLANGAVDLLLRQVTEGAEATHVVIPFELAEGESVRRLESQPGPRQRRVANATLSADGCGRGGEVR
ncbi:MAG: LacI family transcriptional regulator [Bifidobacteriaceae bacterium]|jgi:LacI family transcriptional regulator|nr:LacI family transcriptional regulator [Bifidobacteriaceae bacterium]